MYLARGFNVVANDPAQMRKSAYASMSDDAWEQLKSHGFRQVQAVTA